MKNAARKTIVAHATARTLMTADPETISAQSHLLEAVSRMAELDLRHLPVVDSSGKLVGMISDRDVRTAIGSPAEALRSRGFEDSEGLTVASVMAEDPLCVELDTPVREIATLIATEKIGAVPVVDENENVVGIVSYVDLLTWYAANA